MTDTTEETPQDTQTTQGAEPPQSPPSEQAQELTPHQQFLEMLPEDLRTEPAFIDFKGESVEEVLGKLGKSYINTKKLVGADKNAVLKIPNEDNPEAMGEIYEKLGRPKDVDGYELGAYKEVPGVDENGLKEIAELAYENGVSKKAFDAIVNKYFEQTGMQTEESQKALDAQIEEYQASLKKDWGDAYDAKTQKVLGILEQNATDDFKQLAADYPWIFDHPSVMKTIDNIVKMSAEDGGPSSSETSSNAPMTPDEAKAALAALDGDTQKRQIMMTPNHPQRDTLMKERAKLFAFAYPS